MVLLPWDVKLAHFSQEGGEADSSSFTQITVNASVQRHLEDVSGVLSEKSQLLYFIHCNSSDMCEALAKRFKKNIVRKWYCCILKSWLNTKTGRPACWLWCEMMIFLSKLLSQAGSKPTASLTIKRCYICNSRIYSSTTSGCDQHKGAGRDWVKW